MKDKKILECFKFDIQLFAELNLKQDSENAYLISSVEDMKTLAGYVNAGGDCNGKTFKLNADLDFSQESNYMPIGKDSNYSFSGEFDGNGYTISNIKCETPAQYVGLFGYTENATIQNVNLDNCSFINNHPQLIAGVFDSNDDLYLGSIVGCNKGTINNCHVTGGTASRSGESTVSWIGGIAGDNSGRIEKSSYEGTVSDSSLLGHAMGGSNYNHYVGGIVGYNNVGGTVKENVAQAAVSCTSADLVRNYKYVGGIVGDNNNYTTVSDNLFVSNGLIAYNLKQSYLGAIAGFNFGGTFSKNFYHNTGEIKGVGNYKSLTGGEDIEGTAPADYTFKITLPAGAKISGDGVYSLGKNQ